MHRKNFNLCRQLSQQSTDFEALYAYKHGDYQYCLKLSTDNVCKLSGTKRINAFWTLPEFTQLLDDDDIVSLTASSVLNGERHIYLIIDAIQAIQASMIDQLTMSLYLVSKCQLKLQLSRTQLIQTLEKHVQPVVHLII